jgi:tripartite-type tricarboxylate transporter receptor subunit TctC
VQGDIMKAMNTQDMRDRLTAIAMIPVGNSPDEFTAQVKADIARWGKVIREGGIKID